MRTTIEITDDVFRRVKATAALQGRTLKETVVEALREWLDRVERGADGSDEVGWRAVFARASREEVAEIDSLVAAEFSRVDEESWG